MTDAEIFLMAWAVIATVIAGVYASKFKNEEQAKFVLMDSILNVAKGEAEISLRGNRVTIKEKQDGDSTSK
jgi:hypothetical protein